ncbi:amino acid-binding protein [Methanolapillus millepedarum]|uniref:amino acid-binding protein n=1 Tax=Methanolapillus millepedarum TaxID=3028296 RepID=UPI0030B8FEF7
MWEPIRIKFEKYPAQEKVVKLLFERGFQVNSEGKVVSGNIEIPHVQIGKEVRVDRRVVDATAKHILEDEMLFDIFKNVKSIPFLADVAPHLNLGVVVITPDDGADVGIISNVTRIISDAGLSIRQAVSDDPYFTDNPKLTIITNEKIPGNLVERILKAKGVKGVSVY